MVNYMREYGYIDPNELTNLKPVSPTDEELYEGLPHRGLYQLLQDGADEEQYQPDP